MEYKTSQPGSQWSEADFFFMGRAIELAKDAAAHGEVPVGVVIVYNGKIIAEARNEIEESGDPTAHAEKLALERAAKALGRHALAETCMYVTLEPCVMCAGALVNARLESVVFATRDEKAGACRSIYRILEDRRLNHRLLVRESLCEEEASSLLRDFFLKRRLQS